MAVRQGLLRMGVAGPAVAFRCHDCEQLLFRSDRQLRRGGPLWCLRCLQRHPEATLGQRVRSLRMALGLTQGKLADWAQLSRATIAKAERGGMQRPHPRTIARLRKVLGAELLPKPISD